MRSADGGQPPATISYRQRRMSRIVTAMGELGMTVDGGRAPRFPLWAVFGVSDFDSTGHAVGGRAQDYEAELDRILSWHGQTDDDGIPVHKLRSNLGWHVTAQECAAAVRRYEQWCDQGRDVPSVFGDKLIPFLREAMTADGFEVH
jgi:hypothetical protein